MKIKRISRPVVGPRGGLSMKGSITIVNDQGEVVWILFDSPGGWTEGQENMFDKVVEDIKQGFSVEKES